MDKCPEATGIDGADDMTEKVNIQTRALKANVEKALQWIRSGLIISAPLENGYVFLADAFDHDAVRALHVMRGDALGIVSQVLIPGQEVIDGIARDVSLNARILMSNYWPGQLTFNLRPHTGLNWDLGDEKELDQVSVRVPSAKFVLALLRKSGPLAVGSAAKAGNAPILDSNDISAREYDLAGIFDAGILKPAPFSTIVSDSEPGIELIREGAVTLQQLRELVPDIIVSDSANPKPRE